jgi:phytoene synthase
MPDLPLSPEARLAALWAPAPVREAFAAILALDAELLRVVTTLSEPLLAEIRLAWWRERLTDLSNGQPAPAQPLLQALEAASRAHPSLDLARLSRLEDSLLPLLGAPVPDLAALAFARGSTIAGALLSLEAAPLSPAAARAGARIALGLFLRAEASEAHPRIAPAAERWRAAPPEPFETDGEAPPRLLRPLDSLAREDIAAARRERPLSRAATPSRQLRLAAAALGLSSSRRS